MELKIQAIAGLLGLSTRRITQLVEEGIAVRTGPGTFDAPATIRNYLRHVSGKAGNKASALDLNTEKARLAKEQADGQQMKNAQLRGELVEAEAVAQSWESIVAEVRSAMLAVPGRLRRRAGASLDTTTINLIDTEIREALLGLANTGDHALPRPDTGETATENQTLDMD